MSRPTSAAEKGVPPDEITGEAVRGFFTGAARYGSISLIGHLILSSARLGHPVYRNLTVQFKVFMQLSAMTLGGCIWAEKRVGEYTSWVRDTRRSIERRKRDMSLEERDARSAQALARSNQAWDESERLHREEIAEEIRRKIESSTKGNNGG